MTKDRNLVVSTASGVTRNGRVWYKLNDKFCSKRTYDMAKELDSSKVPAKKVTTEWDGDINPALLLIVAVIVLVFVMIILCILVGENDLYNCGVYKPWASHGKLWFVENTCRALEFTK